MFYSLYMRYMTIAGTGTGKRLQIVCKKRFAYSKNSGKV